LACEIDLTSRYEGCTEVRFYTQKIIFNGIKILLDIYIFFVHKNKKSNSLRSKFAQINSGGYALQTSHDRIHFYKPFPGETPIQKDVSDWSSP